MPFFRSPASASPVFGVVLVVAVLLPAGNAAGGGGPENVFLVYNSASPDSTEIARFYAGLRRVPPCNLLGINWRRSRDTTSVEIFRRELLLPILRAIEERRLARQIDYVVYSCDLPWRINVRGDLGEEQKPTKATAPFASITGATYLYQFVKAKNPAVLGLRTNWYTPHSPKNLSRCVAIASTPSRGFRAQRLWETNGEPIDPARPKDGDDKPPAAIGYLLSTMLAVTTPGRGNTVNEVKDYLKRAALADAAPPDGVFYFTKSGDVRSKTRHNCYPAVVEQLRALGAEATIVPGRFPKKVDDALGVMLGTSAYRFESPSTKLMPGAIGDNLTSTGGDMGKKAHQTPLSEMLRHGAAGASGTVYEPLAIQAKFALPTLFLHYRRGCSLAEAYYQSVAAPYQLLIVGDPLCQPWASRPRVAVPGFPAGASLPDNYVLKPVVSSPGGTAAKAWRFFVDGRLVASLPIGAGLRIPPGFFKPGQRELRVVAIGGSPIESQGRWEATIVAPKTKLSDKASRGDALPDQAPAAKSRDSPRPELAPDPPAIGVTAPNAGQRTDAQPD